MSGSWRFGPIEYLDWAKAHFARARLDLSSSAAPPLSPADLGLDAAPPAISGCNFDGLDTLVQAISRRYGAPRESIVVTHGASGAYFMLCALLARSGAQVVVESPRYEPLWRVPRALGAGVVDARRPPGRGFELDPEEVARRIGPRTRAVVMTNVHNPTGVLTSDEVIVAIARAAAARRAVVIVNEVYRDAATGPTPRTAFGLAPNVIAVSSLSKSFGLGGLRVGWILVPRDLVRPLRNVENHCLGCLAVAGEAIAARLFDRIDEVCRRVVDLTRSNLARVRRWIALQPRLAWTEPAGGTVCLVRLPPGLAARTLVHHLYTRYEALVVPSEFFGLRGHVRVGLTVEPAILEEGLDRLARAVRDLDRPGGVPAAGSVGPVAGRSAGGRIEPAAGASPDHGAVPAAGRIEPAAGEIPGGGMGVKPPYIG